MEALQLDGNATPVTTPAQDGRACSLMKDWVSNHRPMCPVLAQFPHSLLSKQRCILWSVGYTAHVFLLQLACPSSTVFSPSRYLPLRAGSKTSCRIYGSDKHALCFLPLRCLLFSRERSDLFIFMGCFLAKNITAMKGSFNRYQACRFGTQILPQVNSVVSHDSFLTLSCFAATDRQQIHTLRLSGSGQIFWLRLGSWRVTRPVAVFAVCATHITPPTRHETQAGAFMVCKQ